MVLFKFGKKKENDYAPIKEKLKRIFETESGYTDFGADQKVKEVVALYPGDVFEKVQYGYRADGNGFKNKAWLGEQYYIVGGFGHEGDVLVVDSSDEKLPIYALQHDNWKNFEKIAQSLEDFEKIIGLIENSDIKDDVKCAQLKEDISKIIKCEFWNNEIEAARATEDK